MKTRNDLFDNIKAILIILVVLVHYCAAVRSYAGINWGMDLAMLVACSFHMPLFMFISGFFSKSSKPEKLIDSILVYLFAQVLLELCSGKITQSILFSVLFRPHFSMWYLFAIIVLRLILPFISRLRFPVIFLIIISIIVMGFKTTSTGEVALVRTVANSVFFFLGYLCSEEQLYSIRKHSKFLYALGFLFGILILYLVTIRLRLIKPNFLRSMMLKSKSISETPYGLWGYFLYSGIIIFQIFMSLMVIGISSDRKKTISSLGQNTVTVYIAQAFIYLLLQNAGKLGLFSHLSVNLYVFAVFCSVLTVVLFGNDFVGKAFFTFIRQMRIVFFYDEIASANHK